MGASNRERGSVVIERRWAPSAGGVADRTIGWEAGREVIRAGRPIEVRLMAGVARGRCRRVIVV